MANKEMVVSESVVVDAYRTTKKDEELITKFLLKGIDQLKKDFDSIDKQYDAKIDSLRTETKTLYSDWIDDKKTRRGFLESLILQETDNVEKRKLLRKWFKMNSEIDVLCIEKKEYLENCEIKVIEEKTKKERKELILQITKALVPIAIKAVLFGLNVIASNHNTTAIANSTPLITKK